MTNIIGEDEMARLTKQRILQAACEMMSAKGYQNITVKEIADKAGCSEMTVFRKFNTKFEILQEIVKEYSYVPYFENFFTSELMGDTEEDLKKISEVYLHFMNKNKPLFLIAVQERGTLPQLMDEISKQNTQKLQNLLANYFENQINIGKLRPFDTQQQAITFLTSLFGFFVSIALWDDHFLQNQEAIYIKNVVDTFLNGVQN